MVIGMCMLKKIIREGITYIILSFIVSKFYLFSWFN